MSAARELVRELDNPDEDPVEIMARAAHTTFRGSDRWDKASDLVRWRFRAEQRDAIAALEAAGFSIIQRGADA